MPPAAGTEVMVRNKRARAKTQPAGGAPVESSREDQPTLTALLAGVVTALFVLRPLYPSESVASEGDGLPVVILWLLALGSLGGYGGSRQSQESPFWMARRLRGSTCLVALNCRPSGCLLREPTTCTQYALGVDRLWSSLLPRSTDLYIGSATSRRRRCDGRSRRRRFHLWALPIQYRTTRHARGLPAFTRRGPPRCRIVVPAGLAWPRAIRTTARKP